MRQIGIVGVVLVSALVGAITTAALTIGINLPGGSNETPQASAAALIPLTSQPVLTGETASELAAVPELVNFQGVLTDSNGLPVPDGSQSVTFRVYDAPADGNLEWQETQTVSTTGGLFHVLLGTINPITAAVFDGTPRYLEVQVESDDALSPRQQFVSIPYAFHAASADSANTAKTAGSANKADLANDLDCAECVAGEEIADEAIEPEHLSSELIIGGGAVSVMRRDSNWKLENSLGTGRQHASELRSDDNGGVSQTGILQLGPFTAGTKFQFLHRQEAGNFICNWNLRRLSDDVVLYTFNGVNDSNYRIRTWDTTADAGTVVYLEMEDISTGGYCATTMPIVIDY